MNDAEREQFVIATATLAAQLAAETAELNHEARAGMKARRLSITTGRAQFIYLSAGKWFVVDDVMKAQSGYCVGCYQDGERVHPMTAVWS